MAIAVKLHPTKLQSRIKVEVIRSTVKKILTHLNLQEAELSLVFCDDPFIRQLNKKWRNLDKATDVLSFPQTTPPEIENYQEGNSSFPLVLGDIVISVDTAQKQAQADLGQEIFRLLVHGIVHLLGYDHQTDSEYEKMSALENKLLLFLNSPVNDQ